MLMMIQSTRSGDVVVLDYETGECSRPLHSREQDWPLCDYRLDYEFRGNLEDWVVIEEEDH